MRDFDAARVLLRKFGIGEVVILEGAPIGRPGVDERWIRSGFSRARVLFDKLVEEDIRRKILESPGSD